MEIVVKNIKNLNKAAKNFLQLTRGNRIYAFYGSMGAGKTTFIKAICKELGAVDIVTSPTFTLVNEYKSSMGTSLYHIDLYRIKKPEEVYDFGIEEYFMSGSYCFIEWPELAEELLPEETLKVKISVSLDEQRIITFR